MENLGVVLWLPGGGWRGRSTEDGSALARHGLTVVQGSYRLADEARWPAQLADVRAAARRARAQARAADVPFIVAGDSAGAHLALHLGLRGTAEPDAAPGGMVEPDDGPRSTAEPDAALRASPSPPTWMRCWHSGHRSTR